MSMNRRTFLQTSLFAGAPLILPRPLFAAAKPSGSRLNFGFIGIGKQGQGLMNNFRNQPDVQVIGLSDVDSFRLKMAQDSMSAFYRAKPELGTPDIKTYRDYRELLANKRIDAVVIAVPDHWHAIIAIAAMAAGKDVYCEKPLTYCISEAIAVMKAVEKYHRVFQTGSMQRSMPIFRVSCELVRNGILGKVSTVEARFGGVPRPFDLKEDPMEPGLDWNSWCGPSPLVNYNKELSPHGIPKFFPHWRSFREFGTGGVGDWGAHMIDIAHWGIGADSSGPLTITPAANPKADRGTELLYAGGVKVIHSPGSAGVRFIGENGEVDVDRHRFKFILNGKVVSRFWDKEIDKNTSCEGAVAKAEKEFLKDPKVKLYRPPKGGHTRDFIEAVKNRTKPGANEIIGARTVIACHLIAQSYYHRQVMHWDPQAFVFTQGTGNPEWLTRSYRDGFTLPS